jgi:hypothetical protein
MTFYFFTILFCRDRFSNGLFSNAQTYVYDPIEKKCVVLKSCGYGQDEHFVNPTHLTQVSANMFFVGISDTTRSST